MFLGFLVFITALTISAVAIYYSIAGLVAIFAAAAIPIMIMGGALEVGKASTTSFVWTSVLIIVTNYIITQLLLT